MRGMLCRGALAAHHILTTSRLRPGSHQILQIHPDFAKFTKKYKGNPSNLPEFLHILKRFTKHTKEIHQILKNSANSENVTKKIQRESFNLCNFLRF